MIKTEVIDNKFIYTYSDINHKIKQLSTGIIYDTAIDLIERKQEYVETDEIIEVLDEGEENERS